MATNSHKGLLTVWSQEIDSRVLADADICLCFPDGQRLKVHSKLLNMASPVLGELLQELSDDESLMGKRMHADVVRILRVMPDESAAAWVTFIRLVYPVADADSEATDPVIDLATIDSAYPLAHKYEAMRVMQYCNSFLLENVRYSHNPSSSCYLLKWWCFACKYGVAELEDKLLAIIRPVINEIFEHVFMKEPAILLSASFPSETYEQHWLRRLHEDGAAAKILEIIVNDRSSMHRELQRLRKYKDAAEKALSDNKFMLRVGANGTYTMRRTNRTTLDRNF